jgi:hypothetical protein
VSDILSGILGKNKLNESGDGFPTAANYPTLQRLIANKRRLDKESDEHATTESSLFSAITGKRPIKEVNEKSSIPGEGVSQIPNDAEAVDVSSLGVEGNKDGSKDSNKDTNAIAATVPLKDLPEPLLSPAAALVAPDATPDANKPISPAQVPEPKVPANDSAVNVLLNRMGVPSSYPVGGEGEDAQHESSVPMPMPPVLTEETLTASAGQGMPEHKGGSINRVMDSFRRFGGATAKIKSNVINA